jgi:MFS family permease
MEKDLGKPKEYKTGGGASLYTIIICTLLYMVNFMDRQVIAAVAEPMKASLGLNDSNVGAIGTVFLISLALFAAPLSYLIDRWSRRKAIAILAIFWSIFTFITGTAKSFITLLIPRSLVAVGEAGFAPGGTAMIGAAYPQKKRGLVMGIFNMAIPVGVALGTLLGGIIAKHAGWQAPFFIFAIPGVILGILALFMKDYKSAGDIQPNGVKVSFWQSVAKLLTIPTLIWVFLGYGLSNIMSWSFLFWAPSYIGRAWGVDVQTANSILVPIILAAIIGSPLGGILADVWFKKNPRGRLYIPAITMILSAVVITGAVFLQFKGPLGMALAVVYGIISVMAMPCLSAITQDVVPVAQKGLVWGVTMLCVNIFGGGWSPYLVGVISDSLGQDANALGTALIIAASGGILGGICYLIASRPYPVDMEKVKGEMLLAEK